MKLNNHILCLGNVCATWKINRCHIIIRTNKVLTCHNTDLNVKCKLNYCSSFFLNNYHYLKKCNSYFGKYNENMYCQYSNYGASPISIMPNMSLYDIKKVLNSCCQDYEDGYTSLNISCPLCIDLNKKKLYINKTTGSFICECSKYSGQWTVLKEMLTLSSNKENIVTLPINKTVVEMAEKWQEKIKNSCNITSLSFEERKTVLPNFNIPNITSDIFDILDARINKDRTNIIIPIKSNNCVVGYKEIVTGGYENTVPSQGCQGLITVSTESSKKQRRREAVLVTSVQDMLALVEARIYQDIICLPHGHTALPVESLPKLEVYSKLILWFGNSTICWDAARQFAKKLSEQRCYFVRPTDTQPAPYLSFEEGRDIKEIVNNATPIWHSCITNFANIRQDVLALLQNVEKARGVKWKRFPTLNNILRGHRRGEMTILTGPTGSGKTTFISEYSLDLAIQGVTTLWGSFEIRTERLICTMMNQMAQLPLATNLDKFNVWADQFEQLPLYFLTFHGQQPLKIVMEAVEHATYVHDIAHVIIDNVQFMLGMSSTEAGSLDRFYRQDAMIAAFRNFASSANCHVTLVIHPRKEKDGELLTANSIFGGVKASQESDNILIIQQKTLQSLKLKKFLQIAKNRYCGDLGVMPLEFDKLSLSFAEKKGKQEDNFMLPKEYNLHIL